MYIKYSNMINPLESSVLSIDFEMVMKGVSTFTSPSNLDLID